jgi:ferredoxin
MMSVTLTFVDKDAQKIVSFPAQNHKSINQMAEQHGIEIPTACRRGACYVCACKIKSGAEYIQIDKIMPPAVLPARNSDGQRQEVFTCVGGISSDAINDTETHEVIIEKRF